MTIVETMAERKTAMLEQGEISLYRNSRRSRDIGRNLCEAIAAARVGRLDQTLCFLQSQWLL